MTDVTREDTVTDEIGMPPGVIKRRPCAPIDSGVPRLDGALIDALKSVGDFEIEILGPWHHLVFSPVPAEAARQSAMVEAWQRHHESIAPDVFSQTLEKVVRRNARADELLSRFLAALPKDAELIETRLPLRVDDDGNPYLYFERSQWHLSKDGEWVNRAAPSIETPEPTLRDVIERLSELSARVGQQTALTRTTAKRSWWRLWRKS